MKQVPVILVDSSEKVVANYLINRLNVKSALRRNMMFGKITEEDMVLRGQIFSCASIACVLCDEHGELVYPEEEYPDLTAVDELFDMDYEIYTAISEAYLEVNPVQKSLKAKKKKS